MTEEKPPARAVTAIPAVIKMSAEATPKAPAPSLLEARRLLASGADDALVADQISRAAVAILQFSTPLIEYQRKALRKGDFAESVRFRNKTYRELRKFLGLDGNGEPLPVEEE